MKEEFWQELLHIFEHEEDEEFKKKHEKLYRNICLIVETSNKHKELEELNKELTELNK